MAKAIEAWCIRLVLSKTVPRYQVSSLPNCNCKWRQLSVEKGQCRMASSDDKLGVTALWRQAEYQHQTAPNGSPFRQRLYFSVSLCSLCRYYLH